MAQAIGDRVISQANNNTAGLFGGFLLVGAIAGAMAWILYGKNAGAAWKTLVAGATSAANPPAPLVSPPQVTGTAGGFVFSGSPNSDGFNVQPGGGFDATSPPDTGANGGGFSATGTGFGLPPPPTLNPAVGSHLDQPFQFVANNENVGFAVAASSPFQITGAMLN
jgi:hypothetical protein